MSVDLSESHSAMDVDEHQKTYGLFVALTKWGTIGCVLLLVFMAIFLL